MWGKPRIVGGGGGVWLVLAGGLLLCACQAPPVRPDIHSRQSMERIPAIVQTAQQDQRENVPALIRALDDTDAAVRLFAIRALRDVTGEAFGYVYYHEPSRRRPAIERWRAWYNQQHPDRPLPSQEPAGQADGDAPLDERPLQSQEDPDVTTDRL